MNSSSLNCMSIFFLCCLNRRLSRSAIFASSSFMRFSSFGPASHLPSISRSRHCHSNRFAILSALNITMSTGITDMQTMRESKEARDERLRRSGLCGRVLLHTIEEFGSSVLLSEAIGFSSTVVSTWVQHAKISMRGAVALAEATGRTKEYFRPDLSAEEWNRRFPGPIPNQPPEANNEDSKLLADLAKAMGGVRPFCMAAGTTVSIFHNWKSRGKIPARRREAIKALAAHWLPPQ